MTEATTKYRVETRLVGHEGESIHPQEVNVAVMPREDFLELMEQAIRRTTRHVGDLPENVAADIRETAATMKSFPLGSWIAPGRGCGCLVGEFLIAHDYLGREYADENVQRYIAHNFDQKTGWQLQRLGTYANDVVIDELERQELRDERGCLIVEAVVIED